MRAAHRGERAQPARFEASTTFADARGERQISTELHALASDEIPGNDSRLDMAEDDQDRLLVTVIRTVPSRSAQSESPGRRPERQVERSPHADRHRRRSTATPAILVEHERTACVSLLSGHGLSPRSAVESGEQPGTVHKLPPGAREIGAILRRRRRQHLLVLLIKADDLADLVERQGRQFYEDLSAM